MDCGGSSLVEAETAVSRRFRDVTDGLSNTIAMSERIKAKPGANTVKLGATSRALSQATYRVNSGVCLGQLNGNGEYVGNVHRLTGTRWMDGAPIFTGNTTILGPNKPSCIASNGSDWYDGIFDPTSLHTGGAQVLLGDGSVRFISENIDTGNTAAGVSNSWAQPVWRLGSLRVCARGRSGRRILIASLRTARLAFRKSREDRGLLGPPFFFVQECLTVRVRAGIVGSLLLTLATVSGCGGSAGGGVETYEAGGTVKFNGAPVEGAIVTFVAQGEFPNATGRTDAQGNFTLMTYNPGDGAAAGDFKVMVVKYDANAAAAAASGEGDEGPGHSADGSTALDTGGHGGGGADAAGNGSSLPPIYSDMNGTPLTATVTTGGDNNFPLNLQ